MQTLNNLAVANGNPSRAADNNLLHNNRSNIARLRSITNNSNNSCNSNSSRFNNWLLRQLSQIKYRLNPGSRLPNSINKNSNTSINC